MHFYYFVKYLHISWEIYCQLGVFVSLSLPSILLTSSLSLLQPFICLCFRLVFSFFFVFFTWTLSFSNFHLSPSFFPSSFSSSFVYVFVYLYLFLSLPLSSLSPSPLFVLHSCILFLQCFLSNIFFWLTLCFSLLPFLFCFFFLKNIKLVSFVLPLPFSLSPFSILSGRKTFIFQVPIPFLYVDFVFLIPGDILHIFRHQIGIRVRKVISIYLLYMVEIYSVSHNS